MDATVTASLERIEPLKEKLTATEEGIRRKKKEADYYAGKIGEYRGKMTDAQASAPDVLTFKAPPPLSL